MEKREIHCHANFFHQINLQQSSLVKYQFHRKFTKKTAAVKFFNFHGRHIVHSVEIAEILSHTFLAKIS